MKAYSIKIRMGAPHWDAHVKNGSDMVRFDFRAMDKRQRSDFHRELMNAIRAQRTAA